jgi:hypothetical protein
VAKSELRALADALADIPFIDEEIPAHIRKQKLLRETWPDLDILLATEHLSPASRTPCLEFIVRSELLRILREGWRTHFPEHTPHSLHSLSEIQMWLFITPTNVPAWLGIVLSKLETFPKFLNDYLASNPGAWPRDEDHGALEPVIQKYVDGLWRACWRPEAVDPANSEQTGKGAPKRKHAAPKLPYSERDAKLFERLGPDHIAAFTNPELWKRHKRDLTAAGWRWPSFRASLKRIRAYKELPSSVHVKKSGQSNFT